MIEIVNPAHPDKVADRIAGAIVDYCYSKRRHTKAAVEVLAGHGTAHIILESNYQPPYGAVLDIVKRISGEDLQVRFVWVPQDTRLASNQINGIRCGDNGIFKGEVPDEEETMLYRIARDIYAHSSTDGKYILDGHNLIVCQSQADAYEVRKMLDGYKWLEEITINPLGYWTGGLSVDSGATNRKLGSDMGKAVTGGGLHGKDLSKADVSLNIYAHLHAPCEICCAIGDKEVTVRPKDGKSYKIPYADAVEEAHAAIDKIGGFEKFAEWGLHGLERQ